MRELRRVQVRYAAAKDGRVRLEEIDIFAIFCPDTNEIYYVLRDEIPAGLRAHFVLRLVRTRNGQIKNIRLAKDFVGTARIFGPVAQVDRARGF